MEAVAARKREEHIGEYLLYMYQMEDLIRAFDGDLGLIETHVVAHYPIPEAEKKACLDWFAGLAAQLQAEGCMQQGHLSTTQALVDELAHLHWELVKSDPHYREAYSPCRPHVLYFMLEAGEQAPAHEVQLFLNVLYGLLLAKLHGRAIPKEVEAAAPHFGNMLRLLDLAYRPKI
ncbi:hypothetical protein A3SI_12584 [Nitritalea halalkaliphila LW7]|uniref:DUF4924 domain-containing protein n=1 Tax=Nitritalea halalkaliphila LW7 TaxID=1189621 RepID=I5C1I4_9BACT|nr:DUF4924 family protein [Nitritalea halalkaliphila]EIM75686.1 hypothetical protein A3SI_12584 [Nitritalea halalkaliphila LW7]